MKAVVFVLSLFSLANLTYSKSESTEKYTHQSIFDIVNEKESNVDIGLWSLIVAKEFDNSVDIPKYLNKLNDMALEIRKMLAGRTTDMDKFLATRMFLYKAGPWNNYKPFSYDLDDPLGNDLKHQLLSDYLDSRKGNCVSMPTLFLALMERVGPSVPFFGVKAPLHLFCRLRDRQTGDVWNVETTNGGNPARNQWYIDKLHISQTALDNKIYLQDLSKKEYIGELIGVLIHKEIKKGNFEKALKYTNLSLKLSPKSDAGLVEKGVIYADIGYQKLMDKTITEKEKVYYRNKSEQYVKEAESLGWRPESMEEREEYLRSVKNEIQKINSEEQ